ncbi:hypothetical protein [Leptospira jelokensis]|uniref:Uncharacterized protein n=1 Tax=Leptospira jelokensis TaxID=2484931 RepID=A0A4Z0ZWK4_9LEPT|nr:hypothetical protein [Leptospira jelokensis]TGL58582.1 hypothetical protein EHQ62_16935 [Leptospira jelokensis]
MINVDLGSVVVYGKIPMVFLGRPFKIHFFTYKVDADESTEECFASVILELGFFSYGNSVEESQQNMRSELKEFSQNLKSKAHFINAIENLSLEHLWDIYRKLNFLNGDPEHEYYFKLKQENSELKESNNEKDEQIFSLKIDIDKLNRQLNSNESVPLS